VYTPVECFNKECNVQKYKQTAAHCYTQQAKSRDLPILNQQH